MPFSLYIFLSIDLCLYLYIGIISNTVICSTSLKQILSIIIYGDSSLLEDYFYYIIAVSFLMIVLFLSLGNIANLRRFTIFIMLCRFAIIIIIIICCFYAIGKEGASSYSDIPKFNLDNISIMLGNSIFFMMVHHSIPGFVDSFKPQRKLISLLFVAFCISLCVMIGFGVISLIALAKYNDPNCNNNVFPCPIQVKYINIS